MNKNIQLKIRIDDIDKKRLESISEYYSATVSATVRMIIKAKFDEIEEDQTSRFRAQYRARHRSAASKKNK